MACWRSHSQAEVEPGSSVPGFLGASGAPKTHSDHFLRGNRGCAYMKNLLPRLKGTPNAQVLPPDLLVPSSPGSLSKAQICHLSNSRAPGLTPSIPLMPALTVFRHVPEAASRALNNSGLCNGIMNLLTTRCSLSTYIPRNTDSPGPRSRLETYTNLETVSSACLVGFRPD